MASISEHFELSLPVFPDYPVGTLGVILNCSEFSSSFSVF